MPIAIELGSQGETDFVLLIGSGRARQGENGGAGFGGVVGFREARENQNGEKDRGDIGKSNGVESRGNQHGPEARVTGELFVRIVRTVFTPWFDRNAHGRDAHATKLKIQSALQHRALLFLHRCRGCCLDCTGGRFHHHTTLPH